MPAPTKINYGASTWGPPIGTPALLPGTGVPGQAHVILDDGDGKTAIYVWNEISFAWEKVADPDFVAGGDVIGPAGATPNSLVLFDGPTGKLIKEATGWVWSPGTGEILDPSGDPVLTKIRKPYVFTHHMRVPSFGTLYLKIGDVATSATPLTLHYAGSMSKISVRLDLADSTRAYELRVLKNGALAEFVAIAAGQTKVVSTSLTTSVASGDDISAYLIRTSGTGASTFRFPVVNLEIQEP